MSSTATSTFDVGTLAIDMLDLKSKRAVWRSNVSGTIPSSPERLNEGI
ncbi:DUF4136 domain-containing protein [Pollutimonas harenae]|uniref:DUF4136 domain-containing protein n=1 Tax=Pollutimonas harenae TaxID=657015 RepID=A0A853GSM9_9BURK|nr:DUF4136 domain-containing protein [Pollutimonas harenae]NYT85201.1 DUF4136 domain-containing protein [Pollutimonas harenae]TEA72425.1 DUF4136 domain-containing protein [Pollutimonas harenae]